MAYDKLSSYKTSITITNGLGMVVYHDTMIVSWDANEVCLNSGGWESVTTKRKLNQASNQFGLGYSVYQKDYVWYVVNPQGLTVPFTDGMVLSRKQEEE